MAATLRGGTGLPRLDRPLRRQARAHLDFDFRELLFPSKSAAAQAARKSCMTWNAQPILFAVGYALAQL